MSVLIDACVLFPTVLRSIVIGLADTGAITPLWSKRILEEWRRAALRLSAEDADRTGVEIALLNDRFPQAMVHPDPAVEARLSLPDADDVHVLAAAIAGSADELLTLNTKDFPTSVLARDGILRRHPDEFLLEHFHANPDSIAAVVSGVMEQAAIHGIDTSNPRALLKRARLPRLGKALESL